jgi:hypothetical protein
MNKKYSIFLSAALFFGVFTLLNGCEKDYVAPVAPVSKSMTEEFDTVANLYRKGWVFVNNSRPQGAATWQQGIFEAISGKTGITFDGFPAHSYKLSQDEYIFAGYASGSGIAVLSSWMITPVLEMKNGDKISFWTRSAGGFADRLQVRANITDASADVGQDHTTVGKFSMMMADINPGLVLGANGYPLVWTRYEYTLSGLTGTHKGRIGFRYYVDNGGPNGANSNAIGIDQVRFISQ